MANEAGIDLILRAPAVKPIMDQVIDDWKEISKAEKEAKDAADEYSMSVTLQLAKMKQQATENQNIKKAIAELKEPISENTDAIIEQGKEVEKLASVQKRSAFQAIKDYFAQKAELRKIGEEVRGVTQEIIKLETRQNQLFKSAHRGNLEAVREYTANQKKIEDLSASLSGLNNRLKIQQTIVSQSNSTFNKVFSGIGTGLNAVKKTAGLVLTGIATSIALIGASILLFRKIYQTTLQNDAVDNFVKANVARFKTARKEFSDALAPITYTIANLLLGAADGITTSLEKNQKAVFNWAVAVASGIAGLVSYAKNRFDAFALNVATINAHISRDIQAAKVLASGLTGGPSSDQIVELAKRQKAFEDAKEAEGKLLSGTLAFQTAAARTRISLEELGQEYFNVTNLTDEQLKAIEKLRDEYKKLTDEINKQIDALDIKEAGPIAGIILKSELAAVALEKEAKRYVEVARLLGKSQEEITSITNKFERLILATRTEAQLEVQKLLADQLDKLETQAADNDAAEQGSANENKLARTLAALKTQREALAENIAKLVEFQKEFGGDLEIINEINKRSNDVLSRLASDAIKQFNSDRAKKEFDNSIKTFNIQIDKIKESQAKLRDALASDLSDESKAGIRVQIEVNDDELLRLQTKLQQLSAAGPTGVFIDVSSNVVDAVNEIDEAIASIQPGEIQAPKIPALEQLAFDIQSAFTDVADALEGVFGPDFIQRFGGAFEFIRDIAISTIDQQLDAIDALVERRKDAVEELEDDIAFESELKYFGLANDFDILKKRLDDEIKLKEEAEKKQAELNEKRAKIQRQQDSLSQASSLATTIANMFKGITATLNPGAFLLAIIASGVMLTAFAAAKLKAAQLARAYKGSRRMGETFGEFAPNEGLSDAPGRDRGLSVVDRKGRLRGFIGGDEMMNKESVSRKHRDALYYLNENENAFKSVDLLSWLKIAERSGSTDVLRLDRTIEKNNNIRERVIVIQSNGGLKKQDVEEAISKALKEQTSAVINYLETRPTPYDGDIKNLKLITSKNDKTNKRP